MGATVIFKALPAAILGALYLGLSPRVAPRLYHTRLFRPEKHPQGDWDLSEIAGVELRDVYFHSENGRLLHGWYLDVPGAKKTFVLHHGNSGNITGRVPLLMQLVRAGVSVLCYDYQGYGKSEGSPSLPKICADARSAYKYLSVHLRLDFRDIVHYGESLGSGVACEVSRQCPSAGIILQSPFASLEMIGKQVLPVVRLYPRVFYPYPRLNSIKTLKEPHPPLLIMHGTKDTVVPIAHSQLLFKEASEPKSFAPFENANHGDIVAIAPERYVETVKTFVESL